MVYDASCLTIHLAEGYNIADSRNKRRQNAGECLKKDGNDGASPDAKSDGRVVDR